jgi:hypothetical protein
LTARLLSDDVGVDDVRGPEAGRMQRRTDETGEQTIGVACGAALLVPGEQSIDAL